MLWVPLSVSAGEAYLGTIAGSGSANFAGDGGFAFEGKLSGPMGVAVDDQRNVYIADTDNHRIRKVTAATGVISTIAGTGTASSTGDGGAASAATLYAPSGLALTSGGLLYIAERGGQRIRCITLSTGVITTVAGSGTYGFFGDGASATAAQLRNPYGIAVSSTGDLYIADTNNNRIRKVTGGIISTIAGTGTAGLSGDGGVATAAQINGPYGVAVTSAGVVLIADTNNTRVRQISSGTITTIAGTTYGFSGDGGPATAAKMDAPCRLLVLANGDVLISDFAQSRVRKITAGIMSTVYGTGSVGFAGDAGPASAASLAGPYDLALFSTGAVFLADRNNNRIRVIHDGAVIKNPPAVPAYQVFATSTAASTLAASTAGEATVTYTWSTIGTPPAAVTWSANGTNAAKNTTATFTRAGTYSLAITMAQGTTMPLTTGMTVTVGQVPTTLTISPTSKTLSLNGTHTFTLGGTGTDQFGQTITALLPTWSLTGAGILSNAGLYTAPATPGGPYTAQAVVGPRTVTASVTVANAVPTITTAAAASPSSVTATTATLSVAAADDGGPANLIYTWSVLGAPPGPVGFGNNGVTAAQSTIATFSQPGSYQFQVLITDSLGLSASSTVTVTVASTLTSVEVTPAGTAINPGSQRTFSAQSRNQFGLIYTPTPTWSWTRSGGGTIVAGTGVLTADATPGGPYTVTASGAGKFGNTTFLVQSVAPIAQSQGLSTARDAALPITLVATDANLDVLTYAITTPPTHGTLSGVLPTLSYQPAAGYVGEDQFAFTASDGSNTSGPASIAIAVLESPLVATILRTPLVLPEPFDANRWANDATYRTDYIAGIVPGRVWQSANPGASIPELTTTGSRRITVASNGQVTLSVTTIANAPVSFTTMGTGYFTLNGQGGVTVQANAAGLATVNYQAPINGIVPILVASPLASGLIRLQIAVTTPAGLAPDLTPPTN